MSLFQDLVNELKEENLLESTVIETNNDSRIQKSAAEDKVVFSEEPGDEQEFVAEQLTENSNLQKNEEFPGEKVPENEYIQQFQELEFFRKRAVDEVSGLQLVEHVVSGVEREQMKIVPPFFDELKVKKTLHTFLQISDDLCSEAYIAADINLKNETQDWGVLLARRDKSMSVTHLRQFCENTKPVLSSQALISLAKFYRNLPYSEPVRSKFDLVVTRLFSKEIDDDKRFLVFTRDELSGHLKDLYAEWMSIKFFSNEENQAEIDRAVGIFDQFIEESESSESFDVLIETNFFNRLRTFKESIQELFFQPEVTAAAIETSIKIGNRYVDLIEKERKFVNSDDIQDKYGFLHDQTISDATSKTLQLVELLKEKAVEVREENQAHPAQKEVFKYVEPEIKKPVKKSKKQSAVAGVNKTLLFMTILVALICGGLYFWANSSDSETVSQNQNVIKVNLDNSPFKGFLQLARISNDTYYALVSPEWENIPAAKKEDFLKIIADDGKTKGYTKVVLIDKNGSNRGFYDNNVVKINN